MLALAASGNTAWLAESNQAKTPSITPSSQDSNQIVIANGNQTSKPATTYFFKDGPSAGYWLKCQHLFRCSTVPRLASAQGPV